MNDETRSDTRRPSAAEFDVMELKNNPVPEDRFDRIYRYVALALFGGALIAGFAFM